MFRLRFSPFPALVLVPLMASACGGIADLGDSPATSEAGASTTSDHAIQHSSSSHRASSGSGSVATSTPEPASTSEVNSFASSGEGGPPDASAEPSSALLYCAYSSPSTAPTTWTWSGTAWTVENPANLPSSRFQSAMAWDGQKVVLFGGAATQSTALLADTWAWENGAWTELHPANSPPARSYHTLATLGSTVVLFGGWNGTEDLADTWIWDGTNWSEAHPAASPPARDYAQAASLGNQAFLFGGGKKIAVGSPASSDYFHDTWAWDGEAWTRVADTAALTGQWASGLAAFEGNLVEFQQNQDTSDPTAAWVLHGSTWETTGATYPKSNFVGSAATSVGSKVVFVGRTLDTIAWNGATWSDLGRGPSLDACNDGLLMTPIP